MKKTVHILKDIVITILVLLVTLIVMTFVDVDFGGEEIENIEEETEEVFEEDISGFSGYDSEVVILGTKAFTFFIADTEEKRTKGLSGQESLGNNEGLLFVFEESAPYGFWMKDMNFAIDIIWINQDKEIVFIEESVAPDSFPTVFYPNEPAMYVLEVNAGRSEELGLQDGQSLNFDS